MNLVSLGNKRLFLLFNQMRANNAYNGFNYRAINCKVGDKVSVDRVLTEDDLQKFTELTGDTNTFHVNEPKMYHGAFLISLVSAVMGTKLPGQGSLLVKQKVRLPHACYVDPKQKITMNIEVVEVRRLITCNFTVFSHLHKTTVLEGQSVIMPVSV